MPVDYDEDLPHVVTRTTDDGGFYLAVVNPYLEDIPELGGRAGCYVVMREEMVLGLLHACIEHLQRVGGYRKME